MTAAHRWRIVAIMAIAFTFMSVASASAQDLVIDTIELNPSKYAAGKADLEANRAYTLVVSGSVDYELFDIQDQIDALYCFGGNEKSNCPPATRPQKGGALVVGTTGTPADKRLSEAVLDGVPAYTDSHEYRVRVRFAQAGKLRVGATQCVDQRASCSGSFTIKVIKEPSGGGGACGGASRVHAAAVNEVRVVAVQQEVQAHKAGTPEDQWVPVCKDTVLQQGDEISCDPDGAVTLQFADNSTVVVRNTTQLKIASFFTEGGVVKTEILLKMGEVAAKVHKSEATKSDFRIKSPTSVASVRGTDFTVTYDPGSKATITTVREGVVEVDPEAPGLQTVSLAAGKEIEVTNKTASAVAAIGKAAARGGNNRSAALARVIKVVRRADACGVRTPRLNAYAVKPIGGGWGVSLKLEGDHKGTSKWTVKRSKVKATNALAKKIAKRCS